MPYPTLKEVYYLIWVVIFLLCRGLTVEWLLFANYLDSIICTVYLFFAVEVTTLVILPLTVDASGLSLGGLQGL